MEEETGIRVNIVEAPGLVRVVSGSDGHTMTNLCSGGQCGGIDARLKDGESLGVTEKWLVKDVQRRVAAWQKQKEQHLTLHLSELSGTNAIPRDLTQINRKVKAFKQLSPISGDFFHNVQSTLGKLIGFTDVSYVSNPPEQHLNVYENTQRLIYSSVLKAIRNAYGNDSDTTKSSEAGSQVMTLSGRGNQTRAEEYFLGYSNNVFGSHTGYIREMSKEKQYFLSNDGQTRRKRSVLHLYNMVLCATGCNPLSYKGYGCYCGFLGSGFVVDGIDRCCKIHDWCYDTAGCPMFLEYFIPYLWKCYNHHHPLCALDHGEFGGPGSCAQRLCECDRQLAQCLKMYPCPSSKALCTSSPWRLLQNLLMN